MMATLGIAIDRLGSPRCKGFAALLPLDCLRRVCRAMRATPGACLQPRNIVFATGAAGVCRYARCRRAAMPRLGASTTRLHARNEMRDGVDPAHGLVARVCSSLRAFLQFASHGGGAARVDSDGTGHAVEEYRQDVAQLRQCVSRIKRRPCKSRRHTAASFLRYATTSWIICDAGLRTTVRRPRCSEMKAIGSC